MKLSTKEQLVLLVAQGVAYRHQWFYLRSLYDEGLIHACLDPQECQERYQAVRANDHKRLDCPVNFHLYEDPQNWVHELVQHAIVYSDPIYPYLWKQIAKPPLVIFYQGSLDILKRPLVSIIGTRKITDYGRTVTRLLTRSLVQNGWACVSGLAAGVDGVCHQTAMETGYQSTIAIISSGYDLVYPHYHQKMQQEVASHHLLLSEYLPKERPQRHHFIMRNRLVAGLTPVTIVIEAADQSGSLITANYALQYDREVYAVPGEITNQQARGCNELIRAGAIPVTAIDQLVEELEELYRAQVGKF